MARYGLLGERLPHTISPEIHALMGLAGYDKIELPKEELAKFFAEREYDAFNVTIPYKEVALLFLKEIRGAAEEIGAVNTVVWENDGYVGYNTDVDGMTFALKKAGIDLNGKRVLILGTGGTSKTAEYVARHAGALSVEKVGRTSIINYDNVYDKQETQVIINTTPVGMFPNVNACPIDVTRFTKLESVFDCIYNPKTTVLVKMARERGINAENGLYMLIEQARKAEEHFLRRPLPPTLTEYVAENLKL